MRFNLKMVAWIGFLLTTALFLGGADGKGCGIADDSTQEAKIEKARIALDKGNYSEAVETLKDLCGTNVSAPTCDPEIVSLYASAYAGKAGLDVFDLIKEAADRPVATGSSYALFSAHFSSPDSVDASDMNNAVLLLTSLTARTPDQGLQLAVATVVDLVVVLGSKTGGYGADGRPVQVPTTTELDDLTPIQGITLISRVLRDVNNMGIGLDEAAIGNENISGHIRQIQQQLSTVNSTTVQSLLNSI
ncbi:MAG: hypothetical protein EPO39_18870 [Candidatus Manganitrophaceae bacterium]|nr:MAG: hypothetical protein EPO39_18870 [Candidatus Manganitrophaceae bacterium]